MPELPEVETMVRGIRPHVEGRRIAAVRVCPCECRPMLIEPRMPTISRRAGGQLVTKVWRRAKRVVMTLESGDAFVIEPRMTGLMLVEEPPDVDHLRVEWEFEDTREPRCIQFWDRRGLGTLRLLTPAEQAERLGPPRLGPDALDITTDQWLSVCHGTTTPIKVALLDQKRVAGIGNLYASEILHLARIAPDTPSRELTRPQIARLAECVPAVLNEAIRYEGSTLSDGTYRNALNKAGGYQNAHRVYDREGELCPTCGKANVVRTVQAQRSTFHCPNCQKRRRTRG